MNEHDVGVINQCKKIDEEVSVGRNSKFKQFNLFKISRELKVAKTVRELKKIWAFRAREYGKVLPHISGFDNDPFDDDAAVLFSENAIGEITSTGRLAFDGSLGLPEERLVSDLIYEHRQAGLKLAEYGRVIINDDAKDGLIKQYFKAAYVIAANNGVDSIIVVSKRKDVSFYQGMIGVKLLSNNVNETFGGKDPYACIEWKIASTRSRFFRWCSLS